MAAALESGLLSTYAEAEIIAAVEVQTAELAAVRSSMTQLMARLSHLYQLLGWMTAPVFLAPVIYFSLTGTADAAETPPRPPQAFCLQQQQLVTNLGFAIAAKLVMIEENQSDGDISEETRAGLHARYSAELSALEGDLARANAELEACEFHHIDMNLGGCMNPDAHNFNPDATFDDGSCIVNLDLDVAIIDMGAAIPAP